jgi:hypothetical protein
MKLPGCRLLLVLALAGGAFPAAASAPNASANPYGLRAAGAFAAMQKFFYRKGSGLYAPRYPAPRAVSSELWPFSQAFAATISVAELHVVPYGGRAAAFDRLRGLRRYWNPSLRPPGYDAYVGARGEQYYDDNAWIGLELLRLRRMTGDAFSLRRARQIFRLLIAGWDGSPTHTCPGGVFWSRLPRNRDRNTVSTANAARLAAELYIETKRPSYLAWGARMYGWTRQCLAAPDGLFVDHIGLDGVVDPAEWSYNQGAMIAAAVRLFEAGGDPSYLEQAKAIAAAAVRRYAPLATSKEPPSFLAIFFDDLGVLEQRDPTQAYERLIEEYADAVSAEVNPTTGLVRVAQKGPFLLLDQAALVRILARLAGAP